MIKVMKRRVILASMLAFFAVITTIAVLVNVINYGVETANADKTLDAILTYEERADYDASSPKGPMMPDKPPRGPFMGLPDVESNYMTRFFVVRFDETGELKFVSMDNIASVDENSAADYAKKALKKKGDRGYIKDYRFAKSGTEESGLVVFLNVRREKQFMFSLLKLSLAVSFVSLAIVFVLVALFSQRAIRPIANNIKQQKRFITDAGHELKTPLTSISASLDVLQMENGDNEWIDNIKKQTSRLTKLVSELVTLSRLDEVNPLPNKEHFSLTDASWEIMEIYKSQAKALGKTLSGNIEENVEMYGERGSICRMLSVLLDNAVRYSDEESEIRFTVRKKKNKIFIETFNTCKYDTPPDVDRLFDRFYRPDDSRNSETGGTGVGLAIAKAVVESHGGKIRAECSTGKTMTITILI
ncbi:MAG: HAMP domain-containing histidine kinase [Lachnospiraceae bacterium]|nr:HAMP domain-containing histidine kinase [Lachnospiraceae bacterium]